MLTRATLIQFADVFLIVGGACCAIASYSQLQLDDHYSYHDLYQLAILLLVPGYALIGIGNVGILLRYGDEAGVLGRLALVATGIGALTLAVGFGLSMVEDSFWTIFMIGLGTHMIGTVGFALAHFRRAFLPVMRGLPLLLGLPPLLLLVIGGLQTSADNGANLGQFAGFIGIGAAWILVGTAVHWHQSRPVPALVS